MLTRCSSEDGHCDGREYRRDGKREDPGEDDVPEQLPVYGSPRARPTHEHHRTHFAVGRADGKTDL